jgi:hypothetical protein
LILWIRTNFEIRKPSRIDKAEKVMYQSMTVVKLHVFKAAESAHLKVLRNGIKTSDFYVRSMNTSVPLYWEEIYRPTDD